jgi:hypothetical protein
VNTPNKQSRTVSGGSTPLYGLRVGLIKIVCFFVNSHSGGVKISPLGTTATTGLLYLPRVIVMMENFVE